MKNKTKIFSAILFLVLIMTVFCINALAYDEDGEDYRYSSAPIRVSTDGPSSAAPSPSLSLDTFGKELYNELKTKVTEVAMGKRNSTYFAIDTNISSLSWTKSQLGCNLVSSGKITPEAQIAVEAKLNESLNLTTIIRCLLADCPYELFWYDKTIGVYYRYGVQATSNEIHISTLSISFTVSADYRSGSAEDCKVDSAKIASANSALQKAHQIVEKYKNENDIKKLQAYRDEICSLVSYNKAVTSGTSSYGNPWQLIYVFDGDSSTKVVCEGYSKAFKYLCDISDFDREIYCYLVTGTLKANGSSEGHMWNIVAIDGLNYLVDVTNYDSTNGMFSVLFLGGGTSSNNGEKHYLANGYSYTYYTEEKNMFCEGYLLLESKSYHNHSYNSWKSNEIMHWRVCSCGETTDLAKHSPSPIGSCMEKSICEVCGVKYGTAFSHNYNQKIIDSAHLKSEATCTQKALYYYGCTCGAKSLDTFEYGELEEHNYVDGKCSVCGQLEEKDPDINDENNTDVDNPVGDDADMEDPGMNCSPPKSFIELLIEFIIAFFVAMFKSLFGIK